MIIGLLLIVSLWFDNLLLLACLGLLVLYFRFDEKKIASWELELDEVKYKVEFKRTLVKTKSKVVVNGQVQENVEVVVDEKGADYYFDISGYQCVILVRALEEGLKLDLAVEGQSVKTGVPVDFISKNKR